MVNSISEVVNSYIAQMPHKTSDAVIKSAVYSFCLATLLSGNSQIGLTAAAIAGTACFVKALTTPLFKKLLKRNHAHWYEAAAHTVAALALTQAAINHFTFLKVNLVASAALTVGLSLLVSGMADRSLNHASTFLFI